MKRNYVKWTCLTACSLLLLSCGATQNKYQKEYNKVWKEMIQSQAWKDSFKNNQGNASPDLYASTEDNILAPVETNEKSYKYEALFEKRYKSLVSRAYFKIISEAEKADKQLASEYKYITDNHSSRNETAKAYKLKKDAIAKRYKAHQAMLQGLKSWNIFSEDRTGDLAYFKNENRDAIKRFITNGEHTDKMINFLVYKLADLYHIDEY